MVYTLCFFCLQNAVCFIIQTYLVPALFTFYIEDVLKLKKNNSGAKRLMYNLLFIFLDSKLEVEMIPCQMVAAIQWFQSSLHFVIKTTAVPLQQTNTIHNCMSETNVHSFSSFSKHSLKFQHHQSVT